MQGPCTFQAINFLTFLLLPQDKDRKKRKNYKVPPKILQTLFNYNSKWQSKVTEVERIMNFDITSDNFYTYTWEKKNLSLGALFHDFSNTFSEFKKFSRPQNNCWSFKIFPGFLGPRETCWWCVLRDCIGLPRVSLVVTPSRYIIHPHHISVHSSCTHRHSYIHTHPCTVPACLWWRDIHHIHDAHLNLSCVKNGINIEHHTLIWQFNMSHVIILTWLKYLYEVKVMSREGGRKKVHNVIHSRMKLHVKKMWTLHV